VTEIVVVCGSPTHNSRSALIGEHVARLLGSRGLEAGIFNIRELPAQELLWGRAECPELQQALSAIERAQGIVVCSPVYKASYTGILKAFLDLLPQSGFQGKTVLPLVTGGTPAHTLMIDYALRPVLIALGASHIVSGLFLLDKHLGRTESGGLSMDADSSQRLEVVVHDFAAALVRPRPHHDRRSTTAGAR
jgi:FMN reductase